MSESRVSATEPRFRVGRGAFTVSRTQLNPLLVLLPAILTSPQVWLPVGLSSSRLVRSSNRLSDYLALPVDATAGPSHQPGEAPIVDTQSH